MKRYLITGASRGIGRAISKRLAASDVASRAVAFVGNGEQPFYVTKGVAQASGLRLKQSKLEACSTLL